MFAPSPSLIAGSLRGATCLLGFVVVISISIFVGPTAAFGAGWTIEPTPNPAGENQSNLLGVSCTSANSCMAVGEYTDSAGAQFTLAESWNGSTWRIEPTPNPNPADARLRRLISVSCPSPSACTAVGEYTDSAGAQVTLAESWNGSTWRIEPTPNPAGANPSRLLGVSCTSASSCTAVGSYGFGGFGMLTLAEVWDGSTWTIEPTPNPTGPQVSSLSAVSCTTASACTAVGSSIFPGGSNVPLAERWDGSTWAIQTTPSQLFLTDLRSVSCTSASACTAVGHSLEPFGGPSPQAPPFAEGWDGSSWAIEPPPSGNWAFPNGAFLEGVSCTSASRCVAVGGTAQAGTFAQIWDGTSWVVQPTPNPSGFPSNNLFAVSCASAAACTAVGRSADQTGGTIVTLAEGFTTEPTSKDECKNGGWRNFPQFKNEGLCIAFVQGGR
jgi:hypothetical protein